MDNYASFLLCFHKDKTDVYHDGLPIGVITEQNGFVIHKNKMPDGTLVPVKIPEPLLRRVEEAVLSLPYEREKS